MESVRQKGTGTAQEPLHAMGVALPTLSGTPLDAQECSVWGLCAKARWATI